MSTLFANLPTLRLLGLDLVNAPLTDIVRTLTSRPASADFSYIVTPNADHFVRFCQQRPQIAHYYGDAGALLLDSRVVRRLSMALQLPVPPVTTGSDLTAALFEQHLDRDEPITIIGTTADSVEHLKRKFSLTQVNHCAPPFGFERHPEVIASCVEFARSHPARFVFLACGAPRQEILAHRMLEAGGVSGVGLCVGSAIDQIGGVERRAPQWVRSGGLEWFWRLAKGPQRMGPRYWSNLAIIPALVRERLAR
jgi:N-acetylglucosaminyldiphosphoundecaprenol N-acetyl-beta-D-mannosaminyltransferase